MKSCPTCNRTFENTFTFCLADGSLLNAPVDPQAKQIIPEPRQTEPPPTEVLQAQEIPPIIISPQAENLVPTIAVPAPAFASPEIKASPTKPDRKSVRPSFLMLGVGLILLASLLFFIITNRLGSENENASNTTGIKNNATKPDGDKVSNNNQLNTEQSTATPPPPFTPVLTLEGTVWKTKRQDINVVEDVLEFRGNGEITKRTGGDTHEGTWRQRGNKVWMDFPAKDPFAPIKVDAIIQGEEMSGNFNIAAGLYNDSFTARKVE
jgi:hypothetical protein